MAILTPNTTTVLPQVEYLIFFDCFAIYLPMYVALLQLADTQDRGNLEQRFPTFSNVSCYSGGRLDRRPQRCRALAEPRRLPHVETLDAVLPILG